MLLCEKILIVETGILKIKPMTKPKQFLIPLIISTLCSLISLLIFRKEENWPNSRRFQSETALLDMMMVRDKNWFTSITFRSYKGGSKRSALGNRGSITAWKINESKSWGLWTLLAADSLQTLIGTRLRWMSWIHSVVNWSQASLNQNDLW